MGAFNRLKVAAVPLTRALNERLKQLLNFTSMPTIHAREALRSLATSRYGIGGRLLAGVLLFSGTVTLILTAIQLYVDYRRDVSALDLRLNEVSLSYLDSLAESLWNLDERQLTLQLNGIRRLPDIRAVEVREARATSNPLMIKLGESHTSSARVWEYPLIHKEQGQETIIGTLRVEATLAGIYRRLFDTALTILVGQAAKTFLVSFFILYLFHYLVTRHLSAIAGTLGSFRVGDRALELRLRRGPSRHEDELQRVVTAFNRLSHDLHLAYRNLADANDELARDVAARRRAEAVLREREARIRRLVDANIIGIFIWDLDGRILEANDAFLRMVGYEREDLVAGRIRWSALSPPEWRARDAKAIEEVRATGTIQPAEKEYLRRDGSRVAVMRGSARFEEGGSQGVSFVLDLTERKRGEEELLASEARFRTFVDFAADAFFLQSEDGTVVDVNRGACEMLGYGRDELIGMIPFDFDPDIDERSRLRLHEGLRAGEIVTFETRHRRKDGTAFPVEIRARRFQDRGRMFILSLARDITERKKAEVALRESEEQWKAVFENNPVMYFLVDATRTILSVNPFGAQQLGYRVDELIGRPVQSVFHEADREAVQRNAAICFERPGQALSWELRKVRKNGEVIWVRETARASLIKNHPVLLIVCEDITEGKRTADALREVQAGLAHANRVAALGQLTASIAHEVNQPITGVLSSANAALRWIDRYDLEAARRALERVIRDATRAGDVIRGLRALVKKAPPRTESFDINDAIREVIDLTHGEAAKNGVSVEAQLDRGLPRIDGDRVQLQQVVLNLVINAIEAMTEPGDRPRDLLITTAMAGPDAVRVTVQDTGPGIDASDAERLFDAFYTTKAAGLGMGLSICRSIVEAHGGQLSAAADSPHGTIFQFTIQIAAYRS